MQFDISLFPTAHDTVIYQIDESCSSVTAVNVKTNGAACQNPQSWRKSNNIAQWKLFLMANVLRITSFSNFRCPSLKAKQRVLGQELSVLLVNGEARYFLSV